MAPRPASEAVSEAAPPARRGSFEAVCAHIECALASGPKQGSDAGNSRKITNEIKNTF